MVRAFELGSEAVVQWYSVSSSYSCDRLADIAAAEAAANSSGNDDEFEFVSFSCADPDAIELGDRQQLVSSVFYPGRGEIGSRSEGETVAGRAAKTAASAHEVFYTKSRALKDGDRRWSYLSYRQELLVGFFSNVNGFSRTLTPF
ncbi:unnamed protein product [Linum tenue]|uniref:Uncharacterized protein n=1 Tax=Linum tenue TaxID=586396 RepID=A0AAV0LJU9_9ROSI|nr:unnamed protein product [Linum tenue]